jgi:tetratricopeptide (TPR) repeat protein
LKSTLRRRGTETFGLGDPADLPGSAPSSANNPHPVPDPTATPERGLDGWARLEELSYVEAVLWLGSQLADGLAHAHARGILHRDLKPANVLLTDEGRPMLLDFNLAEDTKTTEAAERAAFGGTLPYMAPEHLEAFRTRTGAPDARSDVYSLGVMLFELLTGHHPFPPHPGSPRTIVARMLADRRQPPSVQEWNAAVSPATEAIIHKCLEHDPANRYQSAEQLREDLDRQLASRPLAHAANRSLPERASKWVRRHPRLALAGTVAAAAGALLLAVGAAATYSRERARDLQARTQFAEHQATFRDVELFLDDRNQSRPHLSEALARLRGVLARYAVPDDGGDGWLKGSDVRRLPEAERGQLREDIGETFYQMAQVAHLSALGSGDPAERAGHLDLADRWSAAAARFAGTRLARAVREQRAALAELRGDAREEDRLRGEAAQMPPVSARDLFLLGAGLTQRGRHRDALPYLEQSTQTDPKNFSAWFVRGTVHLALDQPDLAAMCFGACVAIRDDFAPAWLNRGLAFTRMRMLDRACADYDRAIGLAADLAEAHIQRATARAARGDLAGASDDLTRALAIGSAPVRVYFLRADVRGRLGDKTGAAADREAGLRLTPADELSWIGRAETRLADDPNGALADVEEALKLNPFSAPGLQLKAHILGERLNRPDEALRVLNRAVDLHPDHVEVRAGRGVALARRGQRDAAHRDAREALLRDTRAPNLYQVGCIYALTAKTHPEDRTEAFRLLWSALRSGFGLDLVDTDSDLDPVRGDPEFRRLVASARERHAADTR